MVIRDRSSDGENKSFHKVSARLDFIYIVCSYKQMFDTVYKH